MPTVMQGAAAPAPAACEIRSQCRDPICGFNFNFMAACLGRKILVASRPCVDSVIHVTPSFRLRRSLPKKHNHPKTTQNTPFHVHFNVQ